MRLVDFKKMLELLTRLKEMVHNHAIPSVIELLGIEIDYCEKMLGPYLRENLDSTSDALDMRTYKSTDPSKATINKSQLDAVASRLCEMFPYIIPSEIHIKLALSELLEDNEVVEKSNIEKARELVKEVNEFNFLTPANTEKLFNKLEKATELYEEAYKELEEK